MTQDAIANVPPLLGFDPGRQKCGIAIMTPDGQVREHHVVETAAVVPRLTQLLNQYGCQQIILGNQTSSKTWQQTLQAAVGETVQICLVDERYSTLAARDRYWELYPPRGLTRLLPAGMRTPPRPIDDIVAILLIERYLAQTSPSAPNSQ